MIKKASELLSGDIIQSADGRLLKVQSVGQGWASYLLFVHFSNGEWSCVRMDSEIRIEEKK